MTTTPEEITYRKHDGGYRTELVECGRCWVGDGNTEVVSVSSAWERWRRAMREEAMRRESIGAGGGRSQMAPNLYRSIRAINFYRAIAGSTMIMARAIGGRVILSDIVRMPNGATLEALGIGDAIQDAARDLADSIERAIEQTRKEVGQ